MWLSITIADDIVKDVTELNITAEMSHENRIELMKRFCNLIQLYTDAKE